jgi:hypothetical protein
MRYAGRLQSGQIVIANTLSLLSLEETYSRAFDNWSFARCLRSGTSNFNLEELRRALSEALKVLDIDTCHVGLYSSPLQLNRAQDYAVPEFSRLVFSLADAKMRSADLDVTFPTRQSVPGKLFKRSGFQAFAVLPVFQIN